MIPKGATERQNYYIDERTKDDLMEVISLSARTRTSKENTCRRPRIQQDSS